jgi:hypothetical protein
LASVLLACPAILRSVGRNIVWVVVAEHRLLGECVLWLLEEVVDQTLVAVADADARIARDRERQGHHVMVWFGLCLLPDPTLLQNSFHTPDV